MREYGLTVLVAAAVTYLLTPLVRRFAIAVGAMHAARARDVHTEPVPLVGGLAMYFGLAAALLVASRLTHLSTVFMGTRVASGLLLAGGVVVVLGFVDDRWGLGAITKMAGQVAAGVILVWSGAVVAWLPVPGGGTLSLTSDQQTVLTILVVVVTINAVNFIDGLDGLAAGIVGIGAAAFFLYYYTLTKRLGLDDQTDPALASAILAGMCLGFLPYNFHPARIFMGDTGSMLLGLLLAYAPISSLASLDPNTLTNPSAYSGGTVNRFPEILPLLVPAIIMLIPYADLLLAVVRRTRAGRSPFSADKKHLQHRLLAIGHSHRGSVLIMYLWAALFAGTVVLLSIIRTKLLVLGLVTLAGVLILLLASMPRLRPWNRRGQLRLAPDVAGPVPPGAPVASGGPVSSGPVLPGGPGASGHSIPPRVAAAAGGAGMDRAASAPPQGPAGLGYGDLGYAQPGREDVAYEDPLRADAGYGDPLRGDAGYGDPLRGDAAYGDSRPGRKGAGDSRPERGRAGTGWDARPAGTPWDGRPAEPTRPVEPARPAEPAAWDSRSAGAAWDASPAMIPPETSSPGEPGPGPGGPAAPSDGGWAPDPAGGRESGQWYSGRPEPSEWDSGRWESPSHDAGSRDSGPPGAGPQDLDPLASDPVRPQPSRPDQARPDANEYSEEEESPVLPWRLH